MNLTLFFRLIVMSIFQLELKGIKSIYGDEELNYDNTYFFCPSVYAKDGFHCSLQINNGNYCSSENGYRKFGHTWESVEFGFTSIHEPLMAEYAENPEDTTGTVGNIPVSVMETVFIKHGGIDWEQTLSTENFNKFLKR
jgi:hypothetical protein